MDVDSNYSYDSVSKDRYSDVSLLFVKMGQGCERGRKLANDNNPTPCRSPSKNKVKRHKQYYHSQYWYCRAMIKSLCWSNKSRCQSGERSELVNNGDTDKVTCLLSVFEKLKSLVWALSKHSSQALFRNM